MHILFNSTFRNSLRSHIFIFVCNFLFTEAEKEPFVFLKIYFKYFNILQPCYTTLYDVSISSLEKKIEPT